MAKKQQQQQKPEAKKAKKGSSKASKSYVKIAGEGETRVSPQGHSPRLKDLYHSKISPSLKEKFSIKNAMDIPRVEKVVLNCAVKEAVGNPKVLDAAMDDLMMITGQRPILTRARKAIAGFKIREGMPLGVSVTLRRARAWEFLDRLMNVALPRVRDFRGVNPNSFDGRGNYSLGIKEHIIFPEIDYDKVDAIRGFTVTVATSAKNNDQARELLTQLGMPFRKPEA